MHFTRMNAVIFLLGRLIVPRYTNHSPLKKGKKNYYKSFLRFCLLPLVPLLGGVRGGLLLPPANAQIIPDATLLGEDSLVIEGVDIQGSPGARIEGGALRGANLFHSFQEFNVLDGQRVYFANPAGIENILSRVTGNNGSDILGTLGVLGNANLFLVNPNGIVFGPNAQLDVAGSLVASTENGFNFSDGSSFSATNPEAPPLLAINVTPGIQWGTSEPQAEIVNQGNLTTGQDLNLVGSSLTLSGQLQAGRDLNLLATDTAKLHDNVTNPAIATSGRNLTMQGNQAIDIFTLNHPNSQLGSGGDFTLISDGDISGDAHFVSGGNLSMQTLAGTPGDFISWYDPIIRVNGDVEFGNYTGVALKVEATGSIKGGNIQITGPDATIPVDDPDYATLTQKPSVILRAGLDAVTNPNLPQNGGGTSFIPPALGIPLGITVGNIDTGVFGDDANGGDIILSAANGSINTGNLNSSSFSDSGNAGNGGAISLIANNDINITGNLDSRSSSTNGNGRNGGAISLIANNNIKLTGNLNSSSSSTNGNEGNGGAISLIANNNIKLTGNLNSSSSSTSGNVENGGAISLHANNDINITGNLDSSSFSLNGNVGNGGAISLHTNDINITGKLDSFSFSSKRNAGNGGAISFHANGSITAGDLDSSSISISGNAGNGGAISLNANNDINLTGNLDSFSNSTLGSSGTGGAISLNARNGNIEGSPDTTRSSSLNSFSISDIGVIAGDGGHITLEAQKTVSNLDILTLSSGTESRAGNVQVEGREDLLISNTNILTSGQMTVEVPFLGLISTLAVGQTEVGQSGDITINSLGNLTFNNTLIASDTKGSASAGNVAITSPSLVTFNNSQIISNTSSTGQAGSITVSAPEIRLLDADSIVSARTSSSGRAGNINLRPDSDGQTLSILFQDEADISASSTSTGLGGNIFVTAPQSVTLSGNGKLSSETSGSGIAGNVEITTPTLNINGGAQVSTTTTSTENTGIGGSLTVRANTLNLSGADSGLFAETKGAANAGNLEITANQLTLQDSASATVSSTGEGRAGNLTINAPFVVLDNQARLTATTETGEGGDIQLLNLSSLRLRDRSEISASTQTGQAGSINLNQADNPAASVSLNNSIISAQADREGGNAGGINLHTSQLSLENAAEILASNVSANQGGDINLRALDKLFVTESLISTSTETGQAGNVTVEASDSVNLSATLTNGSGGILAEASNGGSAGNVEITAPQVNIQDGAQVTVSSTSGQAGNLSITADNLNLNQGQLTAITGGNGSQLGANINLELADALFLRNESLISAEAIGEANGGNITINLSSERGIFVAFPSTGENGSDIIAKAEGGNGGRIDITSNLGLYGIQEGKAIDGNGANDIDASSDFGISGQITINSLAIDPSQGLSELPIDTVAPQLDQTCSPTGSGRNEFTVTGRDGLPPSPTDMLSSQRAIADLGTPVNSTATQPTSTTNPTSSPEQLVEAQGWIIDEQGNVLLTAHVPSSNNQGTWQPQASCQGGR
ncbi:MAG: filamentous hemagglutinin N-terminal domain-containing protein [Symploca sp. SIO1C2]|nr:filamentous hemagglutinin N-terminal domain-containing protein [Symploca sp. SIO1C2]